MPAKPMTKTEEREYRRSLHQVVRIVRWHEHLDTLMVVADCRRQRAEWHQFYPTRVAQRLSPTIHAMHDSSAVGRRTPPEADVTTYCRKCGTTIEYAHWRYCPHCGQPVDKPAPEEGRHERRLHEASAGRRVLRPDGSTPRGGRSDAGRLG
jgi:ribosomal protein L37E